MHTNRTFERKSSQKKNHPFEKPGASSYPPGYCHNLGTIVYLDSGTIPRYFAIDNYTIAISQGGEGLCANSGCVFHPGGECSEGFGICTKNLYVFFGGWVGYRLEDDTTLLAL